MTYLTRSVKGQPSSAPRLAGLALCASLALVGCSASAGPDRTVTKTVSTAALCTSPMLRIRAGREGESQGAHGDIEFTNVGTSPCVLRGLPQVSIVQANGKSLPVRLVRAPDLSLSPLVLRPAP